jgi:TrmH family RNA methyltransferase
MPNSRNGKESRNEILVGKDKEDIEMPNSRNVKESRNEILVGKKNNIFQHIVVLKTNRYKRFEYREFFVEGVRNINIAVENGWKIKNWIYSERGLSGWAKDKIAAVKTEKNYRLSNDLMNEISGKNDKSELLAIVEMREKKIEPSENPFILLIDRPSKKGNLGSIIRSADAFGADGVIVTGHSVDIYDTEVIGASMGSFFSTSIEKIDENNNLIDKINKLKERYKNMRIIAADERGDAEIRGCDFKTPTLLLIGNENEGLSRFYSDICDYKVKIPMVGQASSLNIACASSVFLYEIFSQRNG